MTKFFRRIRQKLLSENRISKYLIYAIGEIILVVIGILIALSINNWNEEKKQRIAENEFIQGIKNDLRQDKAFIQIVLKTFEPKIGAYTTLNDAHFDLNSQDKGPIDSLLNIYFVTQRTFYPISGSFQAAIAGNEVNKYENKELTRLIIKLYNSTYDRLKDNGQTADDRWEYLTRKYSHQRRTGHFTEISDTELSLVLDDMSYHFAQIRSYRDMLIEASEEIDAILAYP